jgi:hypothetical protein
MRKGVLVVGIKRRREGRAEEQEPRNIPAYHYYKPLNPNFHR